MKVYHVVDFETFKKFEFKKCIKCGYEEDIRIQQSVRRLDYWFTNELDWKNYEESGYTKCTDPLVTINAVHEE